ncbi:hypothetical protein ACQY0O_006957 [Thecaphora frezii]
MSAQTTPHPLSSLSTAAEGDMATTDDTNLGFSSSFQSYPPATATATASTTTQHQQHDQHQQQPQSKPSPKKVQGPKSSYYFGPPGAERAFGTAPCGVIGRDEPREIVRIERDYTTGELPQFHPAFPLELEGRISPTTFSELVNDINVLLISAHAPRWTWFDNTLAILTFYISPMALGTHYSRKMAELARLIEDANRTTLNPHGLNLLPPQKSGFLFIELEYY